VMVSAISIRRHRNHDRPEGQAASALYGTRATNGVIMITTKSGKRGTTDIGYNINSLWDKPINSTDFQYQYGQGLRGSRLPPRLAPRIRTGSAGFSAERHPDDPVQRQDYAYSANKYSKNMNQIYRIGPSLTNTISASGANDRTNFACRYPISITAQSSA